VAVDRLGWQRFVFGVLSSFAGIGIIIRIVFIGGTSLALLTALPVNCVSGCCWLSVDWMSGASLLIGFSGILVFAVIGVGVGGIFISSIIGKSFMASSKISAVDCVGSCDLRGLEWSPVNVVFLVFAVICFSGIIVGGDVCRSSPMLSSSSLVACSRSCGL